MAARAVVLAVAAVVLAGCSGSEADTTSKSNSRRPSFEECVAAWNSQDNRARQQLVTHVFVPAGYTRAGIQMSLTLGPGPNPVGCRVVFFRQDRWVAFLARRDGNRFVFRAHLPQGRQSDQRGVWPRAAQRGPSNAAITAGGRLAFTG